MLNSKIYLKFIFNINIRPPKKKENNIGVNLMEKIITYCLRNIKAIKTVILKILKT